MINQEADSQEKQSGANEPVKLASDSEQRSRPQSQQGHVVNVEAPPPQELDIFNQDENLGPYPPIIKFLESVPFQIWVTLLTVYALFGDDIRIMGFDKNADSGFDITFSIEVILSVIAKPGYLWSFFFWLDFVSTVSLLLDIQLFTIAVGLSGTAGSPKKASNLAKAGRASRIGTKAGRVVRLVRLIRIAKLYKTASKTKRKSRAQILLEERRKRKRVHPGSKDMTEDQLITKVVPKEPEEQHGDEEEEENKEQKESRVSKALSDITTKRVILIILLLLFIIPLFELSYYNDAITSMSYQTAFLVNFAYSQYSNISIINTTFYNIINDHSLTDQKVVYFNVPFVEITNYKDPLYDDLRAEDMAIGITSMEYQKILDNPRLKSSALAMKKGVNNGTISLDVIGITSQKPQNQIQAVISFMRTIFVCIVLTFGSLMFAKDANDLALRPIERMIDKVNKIARNPNIAVELKLSKDNQDSNETVKIENSVIKIGMLLALGFGDAGSEIIGSNMAKSGDVDPMMPGKKKCAIYGFCDIRNFTDATEQLQEDVMLFVNNIAEVVHMVVDRYAGAANKNIGDAFLLVWKMDPKKYTVNEDGTVTWHDLKYVEVLADCSIISFMKIQAKINREPKILAYREDKRLLKRMPGYKVKMGFGLHLGWGIEGAIGSEFKIDASYLSPNVNMASRLEAATKQYGVPLLISSALQEYFSEGVKFYTRQIDKVTVKGSKQPIGFYSVDMDCDHVIPSKDPDTQIPKMTKDEKNQLLREKKKFIQALIEANEFSGAEIIEQNKDLSLIMHSFNQEFTNKFNEAFSYYLSGNWGTCRDLLNQAAKLKPDDGPTKTLMEVMEQTKFQAPSDWKGYRELTEK